MPDGADYYRFAIKRETTTDLTADQIHQLGLSEVAPDPEDHGLGDHRQRIQGLLRRVAEISRTDPGSMKRRRTDWFARYRDLRQANRSRAASLCSPNYPARHTEFKPSLISKRRPQTTARYYAGAADGSRAGYFMVNTCRLDARPLYELEALTLHEAVPGHHSADYPAQELTDLPDFPAQRRSTPRTWKAGRSTPRAWGEELGFYRDPYSKVRATDLRDVAGLPTRGGHREFTSQRIGAGSRRSNTWWTTPPSRNRT